MRTLLLMRSEVETLRDLAALARKPCRLVNGGCLAVALLALLSLAGGPRSAWALPGGAADTCSEVAGQVNFRGLQVLPETPEVGEAVELHFDVEYLVYSVTSLRLEGATPFLEGNTSLPSTRDATFQLTATQAGRAGVQLAVTYGTEEQCVDSYGYTYFRFGPDHTVTSPSYFIDVAAPAPSCAGDCDGNGQVSVDELVVGVNIALGEASLVGCAGLDRDGDGLVTINELISAINAALVGCAQETQPTPTPTRTNPPGMCCCAATSFEECQALARQGTCFGWGDPCPTQTPVPPNAARGAASQ